MARISPLLLAILISLFALLCLPFTSSLLTSSLTPIDVDRIVADLHSLLPLEDAASIHAYVHSLTLLDAPIPAPVKSSLTSALQPLLSSRDLSDVHHSVAALALLGVKPSLPAPQLTALSTALSGPNLLPLYHAASTLLLLHRHSPPLPLSNYDFAKALSTLSSLEELDHTYRPSPKAEDGSIYNAALVYDLLARLAQADPSTYTAPARTALDFSDDVLATDHGYGLPSDVTQAQAVGALTAAIGRLSAAVKAPPPLTPQQVETTAAYLLGNKLVVSVEEVAAVLDGLYAIAAFPAPLSPVAATLTEAESLTPHLTNVVGKPVKASAKTSITSADGETVASWASAAPGAYSVAFSVDGSSVAYALKKTTAVKGLSATVAVTDGTKDGGDNAGTTATYPAPMPHPFTADGGDYVQVKVSVDKAVNPSQVVTLLTRTSATSAVGNGSHSTAFPAKKAADGSYVTRLNVGSLDFLEAVGGGGSFILHVLVGDALLSESVDWAVADLELALPRLAPSSQYEASITPIVHTFRPTELKTSYVLPLLFTLALVAAFVGLTLSVLRMVSIEFPRPAGEYAWALLFQGTMAALMGLYVLYWLRLNIFQALSGSIVLAVAAVLTGNKALTALHVRKSKVKTM